MVVVLQNRTNTVVGESFSIFLRTLKYSEGGYKFSLPILLTQGGREGSTLYPTMREVESVVTILAPNQRDITMIITQNHSERKYTWFSTEGVSNFDRHLEQSSRWRSQFSTPSVSNLVYLLW